jgi:hypothetical protein
MFYEEIEDFQTSCFCCEHKEKTIDEAREFVTGIIESLFTTQPFNPNDFMFCLQELCYYLNVKFPEKDIVLNRKNPTDMIVESWKKWNTKALKSLI